MAAGRKSTTKAGAGKASSAASSGSSSSSSSGSSSSSSSSGSSKSSSSGSSSSSSSGTSRRSASSTGSSRKAITQSNTQVVSSRTTNIPNAQPKPATSWFGNPTTSTTVAPYAQTQNRKFTTNSQSQIAKSVQSANTAQPQTFTYATTTSGNTFIIPSNLSLEARQYYAKLGIATSNQKPTTTSWEVDAGTDVLVDDLLANQEYLYYDLSGIQDDAQPESITKDEDSFEYTRKPDVEQSEESNNVQLEANTYSSDGATTEQADYNYNLGSTLTQSDDSPLSVLQDSPTSQQWMQQQNQNIVPLETYAAFAANGKAGANGVFTNGTGSASMQMGYESLKGSIGNIMQSPLFPIVVIGIIVLLVISFLRPKGAAAAPAAPSKVFQFA